MVPRGCPHGAHLPLPAVGVHGEVAQALELEFVKGAGGEDGSVDQGVVHHAQGGLEGGGTGLARHPWAPRPNSCCQRGQGSRRRGCREWGASPWGCEPSSCSTHRIEIAQKAPGHLRWVLGIFVQKPEKRDRFLQHRAAHEQSPWGGAQNPARRAARGEMQSQEGQKGAEHGAVGSVGGQQPGGASPRPQPPTHSRS